MIYVYGTVQGDPFYYFGTIDVQDGEFVLGPAEGKQRNRRTLSKLVREPVMTQDGFVPPDDKAAFLALLPVVYTGVGLRCLTEPNTSEEVPVDDGGEG
jgi:hypothetical protein